MFESLYSVSDHPVARAAEELLIEHGVGSMRECSALGENRNLRWAKATVGFANIKGQSMWNHAGSSTAYFTSKRKHAGAGRDVFAECGPQVTS